MTVLLLALTGFVLVGGVVTVAGAAFAANRRRPSRALPASLPSERDGMNLRVRDIVTHLDRDYLVIGKITLEEAGRQWHLYRLQDGVRLRWLRVAREDQIEMFLVDEVDDMSVPGHPPEELSYGLVSYRLVGHGSARATHTGSTGWEEVARAGWFEYLGPSKHGLFVERWAATTCVCVGRKVLTEAFDFLPGDLVEGQDG